MKDVARYIEAHTGLLLAVSVGSIAMAIASALLVPWLVIRAPQDVFVRADPGPRGPLALSAFVLRNLLGALLAVAGVLMLVLPGQGVLTLVVALCLVDLPGKRTLVRRVVSRPAVWRALTWVRERAGKPPFDQP